MNPEKPANPAVEKKEEKLLEYVPFGGKDAIKLSVAIIRRYIAVPTKSGKLCSDDDAMKFLLMCKAKLLNPFEGDAFLVGYDTQDGPKFSLITAHQAFLKRAEPHPEFDGMKSGVMVMREKMLMELEGDFHLDNDALVGGWACVYFKNRRHPMLKRLKLSRFNKGFGIWKTDPAGMISKCFDEETDVLTDLGFEKFSEVKGRVLQVTANGLEPTDAVPFFKPYSGDMIEFTNRNGNFRVTPNHDIPIELNGGSEISVEASDLLMLRRRDVAMIPLAIKGSHPECDIPDSLLHLVAAYLADGSDNSRSSGFSISVSRKRKVDALMELGMHLSYSVRRCSGDKAEMPNGRVITTRSDKVAFYYSRTKEFTWLVGRKKAINTSSLLRLSMRQARILLEAWIDYDGSRPASLRVGRIYSSRLTHIHAIELLAVVAGCSVSQMGSRSSEGNRTNYFVTITDRTSSRINPVLKTTAKGVLKITPNGDRGKVWCVTVPTHKIVVRRRGFSSISNNCAEADALRSSFPTMLGGLYLKEELEGSIEVPSRVNTPIFASKELATPAVTVEEPGKLAYVHPRDVARNSVRALCAEGGIAEDKFVQFLTSVGLALDTDKTLEDVMESYPGTLPIVMDQWPEFETKFKVKKA